MSGYLYIIRGLPGSGKSTLAARMVDCGMVDTWHEADDYFYHEGVHRFDASKLKDAHENCQIQVRDALSSGLKVAVANTFCRKWEVKPYIDMGFPYTILTCEGNYGSKHAPDYVRDRMAKNWENW